MQILMKINGRRFVIRALWLTSLFIALIAEATAAAAWDQDAAPDDERVALYQVNQKLDSTGLVRRDAVPLKQARIQLAVFPNGSLALMDGAELSLYRTTN